jgi:hypothetical protein
VTAALIIGAAADLSEGMAFNLSQRAQHIHEQHPWGIFSEAGWPIAAKNLVRRNFFNLY